MSKAIVKTWLNWFCGIGLALYPFIAHFCLYFQIPEYAAIYLMMLFVAYLLNIRGQQFRILRTALAIFLPIGMLLWSRYYALSDWLFIPPVLLPLWASVFFLASLRHQEGAVISRIATTMEEAPLDQQHLEYTRSVTLLWGLVLAGMVVEAILLAWFAPIMVWSWWVYIGNYVILLSLLLLEIPYRWLRLGKPPSLARMYKIMLKRPWLDADK